MKHIHRYLVTAVLFSSTTWAAFDWQGHRGARGLYPENSIGAMKEALQYPITTRELDVVVSGDGEVVVSHEPWMSAEICLDTKGRPVKEKAVNLYKLTVAQIQAYDCGTKVHPRFSQQKKIKTTKPMLRTLLQESEKEIAAKKLNINYNIEIKSTLEDEKEGFQPNVAEFSDKVIREIAAVIAPERFSVQSFDWRVLQYIKINHPNIKTVALIEDAFKPADVLKKLGFTPTVFSPDFKLLTKEHVKFFQSRGIKVIPWTINEVNDMKKVIALGVDGIITDYPDRIGQAK
jgi:glycerophosphoryl diester phosphodiesterase